MKCPYCDKEMISGVVQSGRQIFFTTQPHKYSFIPDTENKEIILTSHNWTKPTCTAYLCSACKKVIIDYSYQQKGGHSE